MVWLNTKQDLVKALNNGAVRFLSETEIVNDVSLRTFTEHIKGYVRKNKKLHIIIVERT